MTITKTSIIFKKIYFRLMILVFYKYCVSFPEVRAEEALIKYNEMYNWFVEHDINQKKIVLLSIQENYYGCLMTGGLKYPTPTMEKRIKFNFYFSKKDIAAFFKLTFQ